MLRLVIVTVAHVTASPSSRLSEEKAGSDKKRRNGTALVTRGCCGQDVAGTDERRITRGLHPSDDSKCNYSVTEKTQQDEIPPEKDTDWTHVSVKRSFTV